jgi:uncharacterized protein YqgC (DUF456 family)
MDQDFWLSMAQLTLNWVILLFLFIGLAGLLIPIFPGLLVMWLATLFYALVHSAAGSMGTWDWVAFGAITILMLVGGTVDNVIIARHVRERGLPWSSIILGYASGVVGSILLTPLAGLVAAPLGLFLAEYSRLRNWRAAAGSTRAWLTGWGWALAARIAVGLGMIVLWMLWALT